MSVLDTPLKIQLCILYCISFNRSSTNYTLDLKSMLVSQVLQIFHTYKYAKLANVTCIQLCTHTDMKDRWFQTQQLQTSNLKAYGIIMGIEYVNSPPSPDSYIFLTAQNCCGNEMISFQTACSGRLDESHSESIQISYYVTQHYVSRLCRLTTSHKVKMQTLYFTSQFKKIIVNCSRYLRMSHWA